LTLQALEKTSFTTDATEAAVMDVDDEAAVDRQQLQELVRKQTVEQNKLLKQHTYKLEKDMKELQVKSKSRGRGKGSSGQT
jgi:hypothetical protein